MSKFKIGQHVKCTETYDYDNHLLLYGVYIVTNVEGRCIKISGSKYWYHQNRFKKTGEMSFNSDLIEVL